ncbi:10108_t:CDS:10 [Acaulospora colombiana]|uniref:10108_t:CDS:1 n=1 Tax=Acaulospora colombiana TaxID=27376 RepID=A0ACA9JUR7_9GLOM|nr:10108_t:CDS:10 [Acaulospora colombiana]
MGSERPFTSSNWTPQFGNKFTREPTRSSSMIVNRDLTRSAELKRLSSMSGKKDFSDLQIPTITENAEDVTGLKGRIRLQKTGERQNSRNWADQQRKNIQAYEYLCHIGEAKEWIEACINEEIDPIIILEESLRNGIVLAKLARSFEPSVVKRIFENLVGKLEFTDEQLHKTQKGLDASGIIMPSFANVGVALAAELNEPLETLFIQPEPAVEPAKAVIEESEEEKMIRYWSENKESLLKCQSIARTHLARKRLLKRRAVHQSIIPFIIKLQAQSRGWLVRAEWNRRLDQMEKLEKWIVQPEQGISVEPIIIKKNIDKVIKIQSLYRAKLAGDAYRSLVMGSNPPVGTIKNFIHLLNDSEFDFEEEIELERLRQAVIQRIRDNNQSEDHLNQLDIKIALLVKNKITLDEVIAVANPKKRNRRISQLNSPTGHLSLQSLDKVSRHRLELYQQLFYLLQTQPTYLARLFFIMNKMGFSEKTKKLVEGVVLTLFGYAQNAREEYLLLKLFQKSMMEELESIDSLQEFLRGNFMFMKLVVHYNRGAKERKFLRDLLSPLVKHIMDDESLDLETDPLSIYRTLVNAEELKTGHRSSRPTDITQTDALNDPETRTVFIHHLQRLRKETDMFLTAIINSIDKMPFGIRYIAKELKKSLMAKFSHESEDSVIKVVGHLIYYRYLNPAIVAPEGFDVIENVVSPMQRKSLAEISKMLNQISVGKLFSEDNMYLQPLNEYVSYAANRFSKFFKDVTDIGEAEAFFGIDEFDDLARTHNPIIYISPQEIYSTHELLLQQLDHISPQSNDVMRHIFQDLGEAPSFEDDSDEKEISLTLTSRLALEAMSDPDAEIKHLFVETKRTVLSIMRVQNGTSLLDILLKPVTPQDEVSYAELCKKDHEKRKSNSGSNASSASGRSGASGLSDISHMKFLDVKKLTLQNILKLEKEEKVTRKNNYQDMLNAIATDIRNKNRRRVQRQRELRQLRQTLINLEEKRTHLDEQIKIYNDHIEVCMQQLSTKKGKKSRLVLPFTRQYFHLRELQKSGKVPQFGSFKYTAQRLHEKGVLISISGYPTLDKISFTISSDEVGIFTIDASYAGVPVPGAQMELRLEDLLQSRFNNVQVMSIFDGVAKVNVNLLLFLINKKFFV